MMLKYTFLAGAMIVAAPALAQTAPTSAPTSPTTVAPGTTAPDTAATPAQVAPAAQPVATGDQVAQVIDTEFPNYDANKDGKLDSTEFAAWMVALKTKTDPTTKAGTPTTKKWLNTAFAQADTDKDKSLSKAELTGFLSQGQS